MEKEFLEYIQHHKIISPNDLEKALQIQKISDEAGFYKPLWQILEDQKLMDREKIDSILKFLKDSMETGLAMPFQPGLYSTNEENEIERGRNNEIQRLEKDFIPGYRLDKLLGRGSMGIVYKAFRQGYREPLAIKILFPSICRSSKAVQRWKREAKIMSQLSHPNIVKAYDFGKWQNVYYLVMEYVDGITLYQWLEEKGPISEKMGISMALAMGKALEYGWRKGLVHRDIKPGNIMITQKENFKLCDLGLAKEDEESLSLTTTGSFIGTPFYIPPEMIHNPKNVDIRSDLYSLGATLFHLLSGSPPFPAHDFSELFSAILSGKGPDFDQFPSSVSKAMKDFLRKLMAFKIEDRFSSPRAMIHYIRKNFS